MTSINESPLVGVTPQPAGQSLKEIMENLRLGLSEADDESDHRLKSIFWTRGALGDDSLEYKNSMAEAFSSPLYSDACKSYFTVMHLSSGVVLSVAGRFLSEQIILAHLKEPRTKLFNLDYFTALMGSEHLSEQIVLAAMCKMNMFEVHKALKLIPDIMITPQVVTSWIAENSSGVGNAVLCKIRLAAGYRVKQAHLEYSGFPDDWAVKVFCGD